jgi:hypothetical protein
MFAVKSQLLGLLKNLCGFDGKIIQIHMHVFIPAYCNKLASKAYRMQLWQEIDVFTVAVAGDYWIFCNSCR